MRIMFSDEQRARVFNDLQIKDYDLEKIAVTTGVSKRAVSDWRRGKYTIPTEKLKMISEASGVKIDYSNATLKPYWWGNSSAGKKGARARIKIYGPLGTFESRQLGGTRSYQKRASDTDDIFTPKAILKPRKSAPFAEFIGILIGDGSLTKYQVAITVNSTDDREYGLFIERLSEQLFGLKPKVSRRSDSKCLNIVSSSVKLVNFLEQCGIKQGNKLKHNLDVPDWVLDNDKFKIACLRGIFDTDGCIFQERHNIRGRLYCYPRLSFVSMSSDLRATINKILSELGLSPKIRNNRSVNLEKPFDIATYFEKVGTSNPKHAERFKKFGGVG